MDFYSTGQALDHPRTPLVPSRNSAHSTRAPTIPPKAYTIHRPRYGPGSIEYELTLDYLRRSRRIEIINRNTDHKQLQTKTSFQHYNHPPTITVAPPIRSNSDITHRILTDEGNEKSNSLNDYQDEFSYPTPQQLRLLGRSDSMSDVDLENQQLIIPVGSLFFLFGFLFMPLWWLGSYYPKSTGLKVEQYWRCYNRMMSIVSVVICCLIIILLIWAFK